MPALTVLPDVHATVAAARRAAPLDIPASADAEAAMWSLLNLTGLLLLGEIHGVCQTRRSRPHLPRTVRSR